MTTFEKNYLRIYGNIGKTSYSDKEKENLVQQLAEITKEILSVQKLTFDISGTGYKIPKGKGIGEKGFRNQLITKGFQALDGIIISSEDNKSHSGFTIFAIPHLFNYVDIYFSWQHHTDISLKKSISILQKLSEHIEINYAYSFPAEITLFEPDESTLVEKKGSTTTIKSKFEQEWSKNIHEIKNGSIKKFHPINVFNNKQIERLQAITSDKIIPLKNNLEIWQFETSTLSEINSIGLTVLENYNHHTHSSDKGFLASILRKIFTFS